MSSFRELGSVEDTAMDAANAKYSAVSRGYYVDKFIDYFVPDRIRQLPPMNLGYYVRTLSMYKAIEKFHQLHGDNIQVVILGCGYDTLFWRLRENGVCVKKWFDIDMPHVVSKKKEIVKNDVFQPLDNYCLFVCDLSNPENFKAVMSQHGFEDIPTIFVDECTLIYVEPKSVDEIIYFAGHLTSSAFISYGMIKPDDNFGKLMVKNFQSFGAPLKGIFNYPSIQSHKQRFQNGGFANVISMDLNETMRTVIIRAEYQRIMRIEMQDDPEELSFVLAHYVLAIAGSDSEMLNALK